MFNNDIFYDNMFFFCFKIDNFFNFFYLPSYEAVRAEAKDVEATIKLNSDALDTLIRIQAK